MYLKSATSTFAYITVLEISLSQRRKDLQHKVIQIVCLLCNHAVNINVCMTQY